MEKVLKKEQKENKNHKQTKKNITYLAFCNNLTFIEQMLNDQMNHHKKESDIYFEYKPRNIRFYFLHSYLFYPDRQTNEKSINKIDGQ